MLTRLVFCVACGWFWWDEGTTFKPWSPGPNRYDIVFGLALIAIGLWGVLGWLMSSLTINRAASRLLLKRFSPWMPSGARAIRIDDIAAVVLTPQSRPWLILPNRIELRLSDGEKVAVSTISSSLWGMAIQGKRIAAAIGCPYEEQDEPDKKRAR